MNDFMRNMVYFLGQCETCGKKRLALTIDDSVGKAIPHKKWCDFLKGTPAKFPCQQVSAFRAFLFMIFRF
jgi:hypothetical protein